MPVNGANSIFITKNCIRINKQRKLPVLYNNNIFFFKSNEFKVN